MTGEPRIEANSTALFQPSEFPNNNEPNQPRHFNFKKDITGASKLHGLIDGSGYII